IEIPLFVGGAALTRKFAAMRIAAEYGGLTLYAKDAMDGLDLANRLFSAPTREAVVAGSRRGEGELAAVPAPVPETAPAAPTPAAPRRLERVTVPAPPDLERHVLRDVPLGQIYPYLNVQMLYGKHLGVRGPVERLLESGDAKVLEVHEIVEELKRDAVGRGLLHAHGAYRWYRARAAGDTLTLLDAAGPEAARFDFPRQPAGERLCLTDYVLDDTDDYVALFAVTCGAGVRELAAAWKERGEYVRSHALQALAIECAEAFAEILHSRLLSLWGFPDPPELPTSETLKAHSRGFRVSFGYPACPNLADQATLFRLLEPQSSGLTLTEGFMMDPEASVSAVVFHHPAAKYFKAD